MSSATKFARERAEVRFDWLRDIVDYLSEFVVLPDPNFPDLDITNDPLLLTDDEIEDAAARLRRHWKMHDGPIANMVLLLENQGAIIARDALGAETLEALSEFDVADNRPYILLGTDKGSPARWRFDAAHELGHIVLHPQIPQNFLNKPEHFKLIETQAHRFAAAFLLPLASFGDDLFAVNLDTFHSMKLKWRVSIAMMILRARHAGFLTEEAEKRLWVSLTRRGWRKNEPFDDSMVTETPRLLRRSFELILSQGEQTAVDVIGRLGLAQSDIENLAGLPTGYLGEFAPVNLRSSIPKPFATQVGQSGSADVIPLRKRSD